MSFSRFARTVVTHNMTGLLFRIARTALVCMLAFSALLAGGADLSEAAQGNQGLQGGWAVNDSGQVQFLHSLSSQYPLMQQAGAGWVRVNFRLGQCFTDWTTVGCNGQTALQTYDTVIANAVNAHLSVLGLLSNESWPGTQSDWTANNEENNPGSTGNNAYVQAFAASAASPLATHFANKITQWEVWNEPNAWTSNPSPGIFSGGSFIYPSNFAWLLKLSYAAIKQASASSPPLVISGGLFGTDPSGTPASVVVHGTVQHVIKHASAGLPATASTASSATCTSSLPSGAAYLCSTYQMGITYAGWTATRYPLDAVGQHLYVDSGSTTSSSKISSYLQDVRNAYVFYEGQSTTKKSQVTEVGWSTAFVSNRVQAQNLQTAFQAFQPTTFLARGYWFSVQDVPEASLYYGLTTSTGTQKPSFGRYQRYATY